MNIHEIFAGYPVLGFEGNPEVQIGSLVYDSRRVRPGTLFAAVSGSRQDGHDYLEQAVRQGVSALIVSRPDVSTASLPQTESPPAIVHVSDTRDALAYAASRFFGSPSARIKVIACTGLSGRHALASLIHSLWQGQGAGSAYLEGMVTITPQGRIYGSRNRPESLEIQGRLAELADLGCGTAILPLSNQDIQLGRAAYLRCESAAVMNVMEQESPAWRRFIQCAEHVSINLDDPSCALLQAGGGDILADTSVSGFAIDRPADYRAVNLHIERNNGRLGTRFHLKTREGETPVFIGLPGRFNVQNALAALSLAAAHGLDMARLIDQLAAVRTPGRTEPVHNDENLDIYIDTAWTARSLAFLLTSLRPYCRRRLLLVCGSGGDRSTQIRVDLGRTAGEYADYTWLTVTNERSEGAASILSDLESGIRRTNGQFTASPDRSEAIRQAIIQMESGDLLVICGKGTESYSISADATVPYSDYRAVEEALKERKQDGSDTKGRQDGEAGHRR